MSEHPKRRDPEDLSISEKIQRVQELWDEIALSPEEVELTPEQLEEAERRLSEHDRNPGQFSTWEEVRRRLEKGR